MTEASAMAKQGKACPECELRASKGFQIYTVDDKDFGLRGWSKDLAMREIKARPREPIKMPDWLADRFLEINETTEEHLEHVDPQYPGIVAQFLGRVILIDGSHRARRCRRDGKPYFVYLLDLEESERCRIPDTAVMIDYGKGKVPVNLGRAKVPDMTWEQMAAEFRQMLELNPQSAFDIELSGASATDIAAILARLEPEQRQRIKIRSVDLEGVGK